jgi:hypothetical protein
VAFFSGNTSFWQVRMEDHTPEGPAASMVGYKGQFKDDPVFGTDRIGELTSIWSDHLIGRPENHMTGVSFARGGYHRIGKERHQRRRRLHRPPSRPLDLRRHRDRLRRRARLGATVVGYECDGCDFTYRDGLPYPTGVDGTPESFEILGTVPAAHFTRTTAPDRPSPTKPSRARVHRIPPLRDP